MKLKALSKHISASVLVLGVAVGCGGTPEKTDEMAVNDADSGSKVAAESAIYDAKEAISHAKNANGAWRDTGKMIKAADKAMAAGDYEKAKNLANSATAQSQNAVFQASVENEKFEPATDFDAQKMMPKATENTKSSAARAEGTVVKDASGAVTTFTVSKGDSLWGIASYDDVYADPYQWPLIYKANASKINDPDLIFPGQVFDINHNALSEETAAAISHARNRGAWSIGSAEDSDSEYLAK